jgi:transcriptional regulator with XRE-family HTH domain
MTHQTYVRRNRKRWALTQDELAFLVGRTQAQLSRYEAGDGMPDFDAVLSLQVIFGQSPRALFPDLYRAVEERVMRRAAEFDRTLSRRHDRPAQIKRDLLVGMAHRADRRHPTA